MGVVYRARDERLDRDVALKLLPPGSLAEDKGRQRFKQEAFALSRLNHPNIATIHDFDADGDVDFLVMEFVAGTAVDTLIRAGGLSDEEVRRIGVELANGLGELHEHGIVHRDLKPGNLRLTADGRLKILDFGLARHLQSTSQNVTAMNDDVTTFAGTLAYMSPEQARGEEADARSDIYAAGAVLYELATGRALFPGKRGAELLPAIINQTPPRPRTLNPHLSESLDRTIMRALAKDPSQRHPSAADLRGALEQRIEAVAPRVNRRTLIVGAAALAIALIAGAVWLVPGVRRVESTAVQSSQSAKVTVAVLPFHGQSVPDAIRFLQIGIPDAIISRLAELQQLVPRATSAILRYDIHTVQPREPGRALASDYVVTGLLLPDGDRLRISVQLTLAKDATPVWGDHYDAARADLLTVQDRIAAAIADALKIQTSAAERERLFKRYTENSTAYERYLHGRAELSRLTPAALRAAVSAFEGALAIDSRNAPARAGVALASAIMRLRFSPAAEARMWGERAEREAHAALQSDPQLAEAHEALAAVYRAVEFDWERTIDESRLALTLNPNLDQPHFFQAAAFYHLGLFDRVDAEIAAGIGSNPANRLDQLRTQGTAAVYAGHTDAATVATLEEVHRLVGDTSFNNILGLSYYYTGRGARAEEVLRAANGTSTGDRRAQAILASILAAQHRHAEARALIDRIRAGSIDHHIAHSLGVAYAQLGDMVEARRFLKQAAETGFPCYPWYVRDPLLDPLRGDADFKKFLEDLRETWRATAAKYGSKIAD